MLVYAIVGVLILTLAWVTFHYVARAERDGQTIQQLQTTLHVRNDVLDYLLHQFHLWTDDPYVVVPPVKNARGTPTIGTDERRCYHCSYPADAIHSTSQGSVHIHDMNCPWRKLRPYVERLKQRA
jgi:hypothetical protein